MEMRFAQNYGWEMGFTPHPLPVQDSCHSMTVCFVYNYGLFNSNSLQRV